MITVQIDQAWLNDHTFCDHCDDLGCRACDDTATATPRAWLPF